MARMTMEQIERFATPDLLARVRRELGMAETTLQTRDVVEGRAKGYLDERERHKSDFLTTKISADKARTRADSLNKTETRFMREFLSDPTMGVVVVQPPRFFELEGGGTYTPDFIVVTGSYVDVYEIKGGYLGPGYEQGLERYKRAAAQFDGAYFRFCIAEWSRKERKWGVTWWRGKQDG